MTAHELSEQFLRGFHPNIFDHIRLESVSGVASGVGVLDSFGSKNCAVSPHILGSVLARCVAQYQSGIPGATIE
jgi:hypothetical protein